MASLRGGEFTMQAMKGSQINQINQIIEPAKSEFQEIKNDPAPRDNKRKADAEWDRDHYSDKRMNKENMPKLEERPSTPPLVKLEESSTKNNEKPHEKTPGRDGPIKPEKFSLSPKIAPFKGPPGKKVRKTAQEKAEEYRQFGLENEDHCFHELYVCHAKGPNGSPTYDKSGFQLDWKKVDDWMHPKPYNRNRMVKGMEKTINKTQQDKMAMAKIFFEPGEAPADLCGVNDGYWKDRVSKDLNIPWHRIGVKEFELWEKKGFKKARKGEYENPTVEERTRMLRLLSGASLRK